MRFNEQTAGIPFTRPRVSMDVASPGTYNFLPQLYLDERLVQACGVSVWGFRKEMAVINPSARRYSVTSLRGKRLATLEWSTQDDHPLKTSDEYPRFQPVRQMLDQLLISTFPAVWGPYLALTDFDRRWNMSTVRPLRAVLEVDSSYMGGFQGGNYSSLDWASLDGTSRDWTAFEVVGPWWLSLPYPVSLDVSRQPACVLLEGETT
jgi:hypothetical protein